MRSRSFEDLMLSNISTNFQILDYLKWIEDEVTKNLYEINGLESGPSKLGT